ncbi:hypothetical protein J14TS2_41710 [Bacillus sp. J14TS2]|uniref:hypothetical protein n=1 Tax=Bacillus sp. J14TS2 TaxID=2807188 RepID=UPI001B181ACF|nr:hypothetical protein [Bacillus sp. J14TS2]GIN73696.1 hypothetical protein J14TS2_41710 [Bacillus sp. J14TS2]
MSSRHSNFIGYLGCSFIPIGIGLLIFLITIGQLGIGIVLLIVLLVISIAFMARASEIEDANRERYKNYIASFRPEIEAFTESQVISPDSLLTRIALDEQEKRICIWLPNDPTMKLPQKEMTFQVFSYEFADIQAVEMIINEQNTLEKRTGSMEPETITSLQLQITAAHTTHTLFFYEATMKNGHIQLKRGTTAYQKQLKILEQGFSLMEEVIKGSNPTDHQDNMEVMMKDALKRFVQVLATIKLNRQAEAALDPGKTDLPSEPVNKGAIDDAPIEKTNEDLFTPNTQEEEPIHSTDQQSEENDSFTDFEKFLENNKQKQFSHRNKDSS